MLKKYLSIIFIVIWGLPLIAQIPVGAFRSHLSGTSFHSLAVAPEYVYAAGNSIIVQYDKNTHTLNSYTKVEGLSDALISLIYYDNPSGYLVVAYENGNVDFIKDGQILNLSDIKDKTITGEKRIKGFLSDGRLLYLVCSFGIVSIDMHRMLIQDTWYTLRQGQNHTALALAIFNHQFYLATDQGIFHTPISNTALADFNTWENDHTDFDCDILCAFHNELFAGKKNNDTLKVYRNGQWQTENRIRVYDLRNLKATDNELLVCGWGYVDIFDRELNNVLYHYWEAPNSYADARAADFDGNVVWAVDHNNGLVKISRETWESQLLTANGPLSNEAFRMDYSHGVLAMVPGSITSVWGSNYTQPHFYLFHNEKWHSQHRGNTPNITEDVFDFTDVAIHPQRSDEYYVGSFHSGLFKFNGHELVQCYTHNNSPLNAHDTSDAYIAGVTFDANNNLWISTSYAASPLMVLKNDGSWQRIPLGSYISSYNTAIDRIMIDSRNWKWIPCPRVGKLIVLDDKGTLSTLSDDKITSVNMNAAANIETSRINCLAEDKKGQIWIGCDIGLKVIYNPANIFNGNVYPQNVLIQQINHVQNLFEFDEVTAIAVDDGDRKWIGTTQSGVFLISSDGSKELLHFTEKNSPFFSNKITDICIDRQTGEVFFATANGLISYRGTATEGTEEFAEALVFPNPVRETYHGVITVSGLMEHSFCKIADSSGNLIWQGYANGGTLTWDGKDFYGNRPATGVYFVFASDETGKEKNVSKILFIK